MRVGNLATERLVLSGVITINTNTEGVTHENQVESANACRKSIIQWDNSVADGSTYHHIIIPPFTGGYIMMITHDRAPGGSIWYERSEQAGWLGYPITTDSTYFHDSELSLNLPEFSGNVSSKGQVPPILIPLPYHPGFVRVSIISNLIEDSFGTSIIFWTSRKRIFSDITGSPTLFAKIKPFASKYIQNGYAGSSVFRSTIGVMPIVDYNFSDVTSIGYTSIIGSQVNEVAFEPFIKFEYPGEWKGNSSDPSLNAAELAHGAFLTIHDSGFYHS